MHLYVDFCTIYFRKVVYVVGGYMFLIQHESKIVWLLFFLISYTHTDPQSKVFLLFFNIFVFLPNIIFYNKQI